MPISRPSPHLSPSHDPPPTFPSSPSATRANPQNPLTSQKKTNLYQQPRFKLHMPNTNTLKGPEPSLFSKPPQLLLEQSPPASHLSVPPLPIGHLAASTPFIFASSRTLLSVWRLHHSYLFPLNTSTPPCTLQSQWRSPDGYTIASLATAPDASVVALVLQEDTHTRCHVSSALVLLRPRDCSRLIRVSLANPPRILPHLQTPPSSKCNIIFISSSTASSAPIDTMRSRAADLPSYLCDAFNTHYIDSAVPAAFVTALPPDATHAAFAVAIADSKGVIAIYRFTKGYRCLSSWKTTDFTGILNAPSIVQTSAVPYLQLATEAHGISLDSRGMVASKLSLGLFDKYGSVLLNEGTRTVHIATNMFRPLAICASCRIEGKEMRAVLLVSSYVERQGHKATTLHQNQTINQDRSLAFALTSGQQVEEVLAVEGVKEVDFSDVHILQEDIHCVTVLLRCKRKLLAYRITVDATRLVVTMTDDVSPFDNQPEESGVRSERFLSIGGHILGVGTINETVHVNPVLRRANDSTAHGSGG